MAERVWTKASKFCQSVRDGTHSSPKPSPNGRLLITSKHIVGGRVDTSSAYLISENEFNEINKRSKVDQWDVLITMIGTVGDVCLVIDEPNYAIKNIGLFKTGGELEGRWLFNWLRSEEAKALLHERLAGTTQAYISLGALREFPVPLLPAADMREVNILLGSLDSKIELNRRMNETMEAMAQAIFRDWFVDFGPVRRKMAGATDSVAIMGGLTPDPTRAVELAALFPDALGDDDLPVGWKLEPVTAFAVIKGGKQLEKRHIHSSGPNPVFGGAGVMGYTTLSNAEGYVITVGRVGAKPGILQASGRCCGPLPRGRFVGC